MLRASQSAVDVVTTSFILGLLLHAHYVFLDLICIPPYFTCQVSKKAGRIVRRTHPGRPIDAEPGYGRITHLDRVHHGLVIANGQKTSILNSHPFCLNYTIVPILAPKRNYITHFWALFSTLRISFHRLCKITLSVTKPVPFPHSFFVLC